MEEDVEEDVEMEEDMEADAGVDVEQRKNFFLQKTKKKPKRSKSSLMGKPCWKPCWKLFCPDAKQGKCFHLSNFHAKRIKTRKVEGFHGKVLGGFLLARKTQVSRGFRREVARVRIRVKKLGSQRLFVTKQRAGVSPDTP